VSLYHRLDGDESAPVLVLASSLGTTHAMWDPQVDAIAGAFRVLRYDHPGHGASPAGPRSIEGLARAAVDLLDELGLERVTWCGLSLGGMLGMWLAANAPRRLERLVLACTAAHLPPPAFWQERADTVRARGVDSIADLVVARWFTVPFAGEQPETVRRFRQMLAETRLPPRGTRAAARRSATSISAPSSRGSRRPRR
jgi:3-oxoadipate enol-lactonase